MTMRGSRYICYPKMPSWYRPGMKFPATRTTNEWARVAIEPSFENTAPRGTLRGPKRSIPVVRKEGET